MFSVGHLNGLLKITFIVLTYDKITGALWKIGKPREKHKKQIPGVPSLCTHSLYN